MGTKEEEKRDATVEADVRRFGLHRRRVDGSFLR
jgi:hypothetical protein